MLDYILLFLIFMLGASLASFILVWRGRGAEGRSKCMDCNKTLSFFDLIPVFSYIILAGKCRKCKNTIPFMLFLSEAALGLWFLGSTMYFGYDNILLIIISYIFGCIYLHLCVSDVEEMSVKANLVYLLFALGIIGALIKIFNGGSIYEILGGVSIFLIFFLINLYNKNYLGEADAYIYGAIGILFGTQFSISLFLYSVWLGAIIGIVYLKYVHGKFERGVRLPFLPIIFLACTFILISNYHVIKISDILLINEILFT